MDQKSANGLKSLKIKKLINFTRKCQFDTRLKIDGKNLEVVKVPRYLAQLSQTTFHGPIIVPIL